MRPYGCYWKRAKRHWNRRRNVRPTTRIIVGTQSDGAATYRKHQHQRRESLHNALKQAAAEQRAVADRLAVCKIGAVLRFGTTTNLNHGARVYLGASYANLSFATRRRSRLPRILYL
jgi:hypothetical protein